MHGLPVTKRESLDFVASQSFPPDTDPAYILRSIGEMMDRHGMHLVGLYARGDENGPTYADYRMPPKPLAPCDMCDNGDGHLHHRCPRAGF